MSATYCRKFTYQLLPNTDLHADIQKMARRAQANSHCLRFDILQHDDQDQHYQLYEVWQSRAAYDAFHQADANQIIFEQITLLAPNAQSTHTQSLNVIALSQPTPRKKTQHWDPYLWICFAMCVGVMGTALVSPLYPLYQLRWGLSPGDITVLYVVYMGSALASLLFLGRLSDRKGYLLVLRIALCLVTLGLFFSAIAWDLSSFLFSRILIGLASSMIVTSASLGLSKLNRTGDIQRAAASTTLMLALGFGLGPVVGGIIAQWLPNPLVSSYIPSLLLGVLAIYALYKISPPPVPRTQHNYSWRDYLPAIVLPSAGLRRPFLLGCLATCCAFSMFSLYASLAPSFMENMVPWHGPVVSGFSIGIILFLSSGTQLLARRVHSKKCVLLGLASFTLACISLGQNIQSASAWLFVFSILMTSIGHGFCMLGGMSIVNKVAPSHLRAGMTSTYLIIGYLGAIVPTLALGWLADLIGLDSALAWYCGILAFVTLALGIIGWRTPLVPTHLLPGQQSTN